MAGNSIAWFEQLVRSLGRWLTAYADKVDEYSIFDSENTTPEIGFPVLIPYKGKRFLVGAWYIVIARRRDT